MDHFLFCTISWTNHSTNRPKKLETVLLFHSKLLVHRISVHDAFRCFVRLDTVQLEKPNSANLSNHLKIIFVNPNDFLCEPPDTRLWWPNIFQNCPALGTYCCHKQITRSNFVPFNFMKKSTEVGSPNSSAKTLLDKPWSKLYLQNFKSYGPSYFSLITIWLDHPQKIGVTWSTGPWLQNERLTMTHWFTAFSSRKGP